MPGAFDPVISIVCIVYVLILLGIAFYARSKVNTVEDFLVAGRRLSLPMSTAALFATWFGAGTLLTVSDEVRQVGVSAALLDPVGAGLCLILAGIFFAKPLWDAKLLTLVDLFGRRFGRRVEILSAIAMVPTYFGWIAIQYIALADLLQIFTGLNPVYGIAIVAVVGTTYTLLGGLWSVTLTDIVQMVILLIGLVVIVYEVLANFGQGDFYSGFNLILNGSPASKLELFPGGTAKDFIDAITLLTIGSIGNLPGQDLCQRIFAARSAPVARRACLWAGGLYLLAGCMPVLMGLAADLILASSIETAVIPALVHQLFQGPFVYLFVVVVLSVVLSTIDSAILSPASVLAQNFLGLFIKRVHPLVLNRWTIVVVASVSLVVAYVGEDAYSLLEEAYEMQMVGLLAPLVISVYGRRWHGQAMFYAMLATISFWLMHRLLSWDYALQPLVLGRWDLPIPLAIASTGLCFAVYRLVAQVWPHPPQNLAR